MNAPRVLDRFMAQHEAFARNGGKVAPEWLRVLRAGALARFAELGFPTTKLEAWRFTSVQPIAETAFAPASEASGELPAGKSLERLELCEARRHLAVFVNGRFVEALSSVAGLPAGARVGSLVGALEREPELVERHLARQALLDDNAFAALNTAFVHDGAFVYLPEGTVMEEPVQLLFLSMPGAEPMVSHPRSLIVVERMARASVVETYAGHGDGVYWTNAVTEVVLGDGARADCYRVQRESERAYHVATTQTRQGRDSVLSVHAVVLGAVLSRHDIGTVLDGPGGKCTLNGLYLLEGRQHADHHTTIDHAQPHCESHEYFNGVLDGRSRGVFNGRIIVRKGAQRTDSKQTNNNLVLSEEARADSQPQLEIYADDVKCTHGATLGPIDEKALFYLKSRGLSPNEAQGLLTYGFGAEILDRMEIAPLRVQLERLVRARLLNRARGRRAA
ncbi:MAG: Fe-S cluster assembly protein SufD [Gemmatimonadales bacterium]|nr:Fe-S cluster assembly protein SufD [Gemmatimonadales bacterium]